MQNLTIEQMWPEVNQRVNYPIKRRVIEMEENGIIDMNSPTTRFCVSFICVNVATVGVKAFVRAWNCHPIAGIIPNNIAIYLCTGKAPKP